MQKKIKYFLTRYTYDLRRQRVWQVITKYLQDKYIPEDSVIVDVGAGYCDFINNIKAKEKYAVDSWEDFLKYAKAEVKTYIAKCQDLSCFSSEFFDIVFSSNLLEHLSFKDIEITLNEFYRILKFGGKLILILPNFRYCYKVFYDDYTHITPLTHTGIRDLLIGKNFEIVNIKPKFLPFSLKSGFPVSKFVVSLYLRLPFKPFAGQMLVVCYKTK